MHLVLFPFQLYQKKSVHSALLKSSGLLKNEMPPFEEKTLKTEKVLKVMINLCSVFLNDTSSPKNSYFELHH